MSHIIHKFAGMFVRPLPLIIAGCSVVVTVILLSSGTLAVYAANATVYTDCASVQDTAARKSCLEQSQCAGLSKDVPAGPTLSGQPLKSDYQTCADAIDACTGSDCVLKYINPMIKVLAALVGLVVTLSVIIAGIQYSMAKDESSKIVAAKTRLGKAVIALLTYIFMFALLQWLLPGGIL